MKPILTLFLSALLCYNATQAQTSFSGPITSNTTWTKANSPYIITGNVAVDENTTLTLEPGTVVKFDGLHTFYVYGSIIAEGTTADSIRFTSNKAIPEKENWRGITFTDKAKNDSSKFNYCVLEYADVALRVEESYVTLTNSAIRHNFTGITITKTPKHPVISYNTFTNNYECIYISYYVEDAQVIGNELAYSGGGITNNMTFDNSSSPTVIENNLIHHNNRGITSGSTGKTPHVKNNVVHSNAQHGISFLSDGSILTEFYGNQIYNNKIGFELSGISGPVTHNSISHNDINIRMGWAAGIDLSYNCIYAAKEKDFVYTFFEDVNFKNNYWGSTDSTIIANAIVDFYEDVKAGKVTFWPYLTAADSSCKPVPALGIAVNNQKQTQLTAYPNPVSDVLNIRSNVNTGTIAILNIAGSTIYNAEVRSSNTSVATGNWPAGMYIIRHTDKDGNGTHLKFNKQ